MAKISDTAAKNRQYNQLLTELSSSIPALEADIDKYLVGGDNLHNGDISIDPSNLPSLVANLDQLSGRVVDQGRLMQELRACGEDLIAVLRRFNCHETPKVYEMNHQIEILDDQFDQLQDSIVAKHRQLGAAIELINATTAAALEEKYSAVELIYAEVEEMFNWSEGIGKIVDAWHTVSLDRMTLDAQVEDIRRLDAEVKGKAGTMQHIADQLCTSMDDDEFVTNVEKLLEHYDHVVALTQIRSRHVATVLQKLTELHEKIKHVDTWLTNGIISLKAFPEGNYGGANLENLSKEKLKIQTQVDAVERNGRELLADPLTSDKLSLRATLADVRDKWHNLTELMVQMSTNTALLEIDDLLKYFDAVESEVLAAEQLSTNPDLLATQLKDHKVFHSELQGKQKILAETISRCYGKLRESFSEEADKVRIRLSSICEQAESVAKISSDRLIMLEEKLPLASYFYQTRAQLLSLAGDVAEDVESITISVDENLEILKNSVDIAKGAQRLIDDHKSLLADFVSTGSDLIMLSCKTDADSLQQDIDLVSSKYESVKQVTRNKKLELDEAITRLSPDEIVGLDSIVDNLYYLNGRVASADPISANPVTLQAQIEENNTIVEDLQICGVLLKHLRNSCSDNFKRQAESVEEPNNILREEVQSVEDLHSHILDSTRQRAALLNSAVSIAEKFREEYEQVMQALSNLRYDLISQDLPGVEPETVQQQQMHLQAIVDDLNLVLDGLDQVAGCRKTAEELRRLCDPAAMTEIKKNTEDMELLGEELEDSVKERGEVLRTALMSAQNYSTYMGAVSSWLQQVETKLNYFSLIASNTRAVQVQIDELKAFKIQMRPYYSDIEHLNHYMTELNNISPTMAQTLTAEVTAINQRWSFLFQELSSREVHLLEISIQLGEVNESMNDVIVFLHQIEADLMRVNPEMYSDPGTLCLHIKNIQHELLSHDPIIHKLNDIVNVLVEEGKQSSTSLSEKQREMMNTYMTTRVLARDKIHETHCHLIEVKVFLGNVDDLLAWMSRFQMQIKSTSWLRALPQGIKAQHEAIKTSYAALCEREREAGSLMLKGEDLITKCREQDAQCFKAKLSLLQERMTDAKARAVKQQKNIEEQMGVVDQFHESLSTHRKWMEKTEMLLETFQNRRKTVEKILEQLHIHEELKKDVDDQNKLTGNIAHTGSYLLYFGCKRDTAYIKNLLVKTNLRWKKLVRRVDETGRQLKQAYRENKRFYDSWKSLMDWLKRDEERLKKVLTDSTSGKPQHDEDELCLQLRMSAKHPVYYSTMRLGCSLRDQCTGGGNDPDRLVLNNMLDDLKNKWNHMRSLATQKQVKLEEGLMSSGRVTDVLHSLLDWLTRAEAYLVQDQSILGDVDTVNILLEKHRLFQQEVAGRRGIMDVILATPGLDETASSQIDELTNVWDKVHELIDITERKLQDSLKLAERFRDAIQVIRDWLPQVETELKLHQIPDDEESILQLVESHEKLQEELEAQQPQIEKIRSLADEILRACHPNGVRFIKYYLTITQTRWEQAVSRSNQRAQRLQEALRNARCNAVQLEELIAWLADSHSLLVAKSKDSIPEDVTVVETLVREHQEFHEDLASKSRDVEQLIKGITGSVVGVTAAGKKPSRSNGIVKPSDADAASPRAVALQSRWKTVWQMSCDRSKKLQDVLSRLLETESCRNFDFDVWRQNYISWNRANKLKFMDFFRRLDTQGTGTLTRRDFIDGIMSSRFPTNATELNAVFNVFDSKRIGRIQYRNFVEAIMRPDRQIATVKSASNAMSDGALISQQMEDALTHCQCRTQFSMFKVDESRYKFGNKDKMWNVRLMNGAVFVRLGSGWMPFDEFLDSNDPCRVKTRVSSSRSGLNSRLSGSANNLTISNLAKTKNTHLAKSWSNLASTSLLSSNTKNNSSLTTSPKNSASSRAALSSLSVHSPAGASPKPNMSSSTSTLRSPQRSYAMSTPTSPTSFNPSSLVKRNQLRTPTSPSTSSVSSESFSVSAPIRSPQRLQTSSARGATITQSVIITPRSTTLSSSSTSPNSGSNHIDSNGRSRTPSGNSKSSVLRSASPNPKKLTTSSSGNLFSLRQSNMNF